MEMGARGVDGGAEEGCGDAALFDGVGGGEQRAADGGGRGAGGQGAEVLDRFEVGDDGGEFFGEFGRGEPVGELVGGGVEVGGERGECRGEKGVEGDWWWEVHGASVRSVIGQVKVLCLDFCRFCLVLVDERGVGLDWEGAGQGRAEFEMFEARIALAGVQGSDRRSGAPGSGFRVPDSRFQIPELRFEI